MMSFSPENRKRVKIVHHDLKAELNPLVRSEIGKVDYVLHLAAGSHDAKDGDGDGLVQDTTKQERPIDSQL